MFNDSSLDSFDGSMPSKAAPTNIAIVCHEQISFPKPVSPAIRITNATEEQNSYQKATSVSKAVTSERDAQRTYKPVSRSLNFNSKSPVDRQKKGETD
ncbi:Laminin subunit alpha-1 [Frankliniella fusca]|uniref:Laminin subunit alpha-1 n=1 Tax=Frankliniella fusca TaxID=407009 RepID=A0AAE1HX15_9NEOP|nr:Laminin subunit alpha-1 [Frankliniella fusca]